jgi:hypothetical protein
VPGSCSGFRFEVPGAGFEVRHSNPELRTPNLELEPEHEPGTWNVELGTVLFIGYEFFRASR